MKFTEALRLVGDSTAEVEYWVTGTIECLEEGRPEAARFRAGEALAAARRAGNAVHHVYVQSGGPTRF